MSILNLFKKKRSPCCNAKIDDVRILGYRKTECTNCYKAVERFM